jgi:DNA polymerase-3 subunit gamma/tau
VREEAVKPVFQKPAPAFQPPKRAEAQEARPFVPPTVQERSFSPKPLTDNGKTAETHAAPRGESAEWKNIPVDTSLAWESFLAVCEEGAEIPIPMLRQFTGEVRGDWLVLQPFSQVIGQQMQRPDKLRQLENLASKWAGRPLQPVFRAPQRIVRTEAELKEEMSRHPVVKHLQEAYDAMLVRCTPSR